MQLIVTRSKSIRQDEVTIRGTRMPGPWKELYDPMTDSFWYYNIRTGQNTWECPLSLQKDLICTWAGYHTFGGLKSQERCRCVFSFTIEYHGHLRRGHAWHCEACGYLNTGVTFPVCSLCENSRSADGQDGEQVC